MKHYCLYLTIDIGLIVFKSLFTLFEWYFLVGSWFKDSTNLFELIFYGMLFIALVTELFDFWNRFNYHLYNGGDKNVNIKIITFYNHNRSVNCTLYNIRILYRAYDI